MTTTNEPARGELRFTDQVVLVTGGNRGLGEAFTRCLAYAGATVAVNSTGADESAEALVDGTCWPDGRKAFAVPGRVEEAESLITATLDKGGRLDAVIHNAGFRARQDPAQDDRLSNGMRCLMFISRVPGRSAKQPGRTSKRPVLAGWCTCHRRPVCMATSVRRTMPRRRWACTGLCQTAALEGAALNICCNVVAPFGATTMNSANMPDELKALIKTDYVAPLIGYLAHPDCVETGSLFEASGGTLQEGSLGARGWAYDSTVTKPMSIGAIADGWEIRSRISATRSTRQTCARRCVGSTSNHPLSSLALTELSPGCTFEPRHGQRNCPEPAHQQ